jgi:hypothetical protein
MRRNRSRFWDRDGTGEAQSRAQQHPALRRVCACHISAFSPSRMQEERGRTRRIAPGVEVQQQQQRQTGMQDHRKGEQGARGVGILRHLFGIIPASRFRSSVVVGCLGRCLPSAIPVMMSFSLSDLTLPDIVRMIRQPHIWICHPGTDLVDLPTGQCTRPARLGDCRCSHRCVEMLKLQFVSSQPGKTKVHTPSFQVSVTTRSMLRL